MKVLLSFLLLLHCSLYGIDRTHLAKTLGLDRPEENAFDITLVPGETKDENVMICFHGFGGNNQLNQILKSYGVIKDHLVSFNFPDHDIKQQFNPIPTAFGTIHELVPALYVLKQCVINGHVNKISLYGFSAGGAAVINVLAVLNTSLYKSQLQKIGLNDEQKIAILKAIQNGCVILDSPLKSMEEVLAVQGKTYEYEIIAKHYRENKLRPIDTIELLKNLSLNVLLYFEVPDDALSNRDDFIFIDKLRNANVLGNTCVTLGKSEGHTGYHKLLWDSYPNFLSGNYRNILLKNTD